MSRSQARAVLDWISRVDAVEANELALAGGVALGMGLDRASIPGTWLGAGATSMGLSGECNLIDARRLFIHGVGPESQAVLSPSVDKSFYSMVFDVDKTVSMLLAHPDERVRQALTESMDLAIAKAFALLEDQARIRRGKGGVRSERPMGLTGLRFLHQASSAGDPHAHIHLMMLATAQGADGKWITLDGRQLFAQGIRMATQEFQNQLRVELARRLDFDALEPVFIKVGSTYMLSFQELVPASHALSSASRSMAQAWKEISGHGVIRGLSSRQHQIAWARHRKGKKELAERLEHELDEALAEGGERANKLRSLWRKKMGSEADVLRRLRVRDTLLAPSEATLKVSSAVLQRDLARWYTFNLADLANFLRLGDPTMSGEEGLRAAARKVLDDPYLVASEELKEVYRYWLAMSERNEPVDTATLTRIYGIAKHDRITTTDAIARENAIRNRAIEATKIQRVALQPALPNTATFEQAKVIGMMAKGRALTVISGVAGSGKTFVLRPVTEAAKRAKLNVTVVARNANLARDLGDELGARQYSLAGLKRALENQRFDLDTPQIIIVDEAGLIDHGDWRMLLTLARDYPVQIVAVGDRRQAQPIDQRATFAAITNALEAIGAVGKLETTFRNKAWVGEATALREGDREGVMQKAKVEGRIIGAASEEILQWGAKIYQEHRAQGEDLVVLARDNETAADLASAIQESLGIAGTQEISKEQRCGIGDQVRTRLNVRELGITNGDRFRVAGFTRDGIRLERHPGDVPIVVSYDYARDWVELAYASTIDSVQGQTRDRVVVLVDEGLGNTQLYSGATRGKQAPIYLVKTEGTDPEEVLAQALTHDDLVPTLQEMLAPRDLLQERQAAPRDIRPEPPAMNPQGLRRDQQQDRSTSQSKPQPDRTQPGVRQAQPASTRAQVSRPTSPPKPERSANVPSEGVPEPSQSRANPEPPRQHSEPTPITPVVQQDRNERSPIHPKVPESPTRVPVKDGDAQMATPPSSPRPALSTSIPSGTNSGSSEVNHDRPELPMARHASPPRPSRAAGDNRPETLLVNTPSDDARTQQDFEPSPPQWPSVDPTDDSTSHQLDPGRRNLEEILPDYENSTIDEHPAVEPHELSSVSTANHLTSKPPKTRSALDAWTHLDDLSELNRALSDADDNVHEQSIARLFTPMERRVTPLPDEYPEEGIAYQPGD